MRHTNGGCEGAADILGRTVKLCTRLGIDVPMDGSATHVSMMRSWMAPSASSNLEVRICSKRCLAEDREGERLAKGQGGRVVRGGSEKVGRASNRAQHTRRCGGGCNVAYTFGRPGGGDEAKRQY